MGADATHRPGPGQGQAPPDVLVGADEGPGRRPAVWAAAVVAAVVVGAATVDRSPAPRAPLLALRHGELLPRDRTVGHRVAEAGMHVEVVNTTDRALDVRAARLVPGTWEVDVVDGTLVQPGRSIALSLHRTVVCDERASYGPFPEHLVLEAQTSHDEAAVVRLPVADPAAYGGRLDDALRDPGRACLVASGAGSGPLGDLVDSTGARRAWPPVPSS